MTPSALRLRKAAALLWLSAGIPTAAWSISSTPGGLTLQQPLGARATAMGQGFVAADGGIDSIGYNPAGVSTAAHPSLQTAYTRGVVDDSFGSTAYVHPLGPVVLAAGAAYYDAGTVALNLSNGNTGTVRAQQDFYEMLGLGADLGYGFSAGGLAKAYQFSLGQQAHAQGFAADAGLIYHTPLDGLNLGGSVQNMGPSIKYETGGDVLPTTYRAGAAYLLDLERLNLVPRDGANFFTKYLVTADAIFVRQQPVEAATGLEMDMPFGKFTHVLVRAGFLWNSDSDGLTIGLGFRERHFILDYAVGIQKSLGNLNRFSIGYEF